PQLQRDQKINPSQPAVNTISRISRDFFVVAGLFRKGARLSHSRAAKIFLYAEGKENSPTPTPTKTAWSPAQNEATTPFRSPRLRGLRETSGQSRVDHRRR